MKHIIKNLLVCLAFVMPMSVFGGNAMLNVEPFSIEAGQEQEMLIDLTNTNDELTLVQFDLYLPAGLSISQTDGELDFDMCDRTTWRRHTLDVNQIDDGHYRFLLYSGNNVLISGTEGAVIKTTLIADNSFTGGNIIIDDALLVTPDQKEIKPETYTYALNYHADSYEPFVYFVGPTNHWAYPDQKLALSNANGVYTGFIYIAGGQEFKFQKRAGDWTDDSQLNSNNLASVSGDFEKTSDNYNASAGEGVYYVELDLAKSILKGTFVHTMSIIGDFNGWGDDVVMSWNAQQYCYEVTNPGITEKGWKFRVNKDWAINLGGELLSNIVAGGADLVESGNFVRLYPTRTTSDNIYCTVETIVPQERAYLSIESFAIKAGETKEMVIDLTNPEDELTLVQFDLHLPAGLSIKEANGELEFDMCDRTTWRRHTLDANKIGDGHYRFLLYSGNNTLISGTEGAIIKTTVMADNSFDFHDKKIVIDNTLLVSPQQDETKPRAYEYALPDPSEPNPLPKGDVNGDGKVGTGDIVAVTNVAAGITIDADTIIRADVNGDGQVGIGDIITIINIMAGSK